MIDYSRSKSDSSYDLTAEMQLFVNYTSLAITAIPEQRDITVLQTPVEAYVSDFIPDANIPILPQTRQLVVNTTLPLPQNFTGTVRSVFYYTFTNTSLPLVIVPHT